jgi:hypothetical protein
MEGIKWHTEIRKISELKEWEDNPRIISESRYERLKESIKKRGFHDIIKIDENNVVLSGNQRLKALKELGYEEVECKVSDKILTQDEKDEVAIESNMQDGEWDMDKLAEGFGEVMEEIGFQDLLPVNFGDKNEEIDVDDFSDEYTVRLKYTEEQYNEILSLLSAKAEKLNQETNELLILYLLRNA